MFGMGWDTLAVIAAAILLPVALGIWWTKRQASHAASAAAQLFQEIVRVLEAAPTETSAHAEAIRLYNEMHLSALPIYSGMLYQIALAHLQQHPDSTNAKVFALGVGRLHLGMQRPDGKVTVYDEHAIQNDILARSRP